MTISGEWIVSLIFVKFSFKEYNTSMKNEIRHINPLIQKAADDYEKALMKLRAAQDPLIKNTLRQTALSKLNDAVIVTEACELQNNLKLKPPSNN